MVLRLVWLLALLGVSLVQGREAGPEVGESTPELERIAPLESPLDMDTGLGLARLGQGEDGYHINFSPAADVVPRVEYASLPGGGYGATIIGRFYVSWQISDLENDVVRRVGLEADNILVIFSQADPNAGPLFLQLGKGEQILPAELVRGIYLYGDVTLTEGTRFIQAEEIYYDVPRQRALALQASLRAFDAGRKIPIYVRAAELRQHSEDLFTAKDTVLTTSEFYRPQISVTATKIIVTDTTSMDTETGQLSDDSFQAEMQDVRFKAHDVTLLKLPKVYGDLKQPDMPLRNIRMGQDSLWGMSVETEWDLPRLLGLRTAEGVDSDVSLDYYSKRGPGIGYDLDYERDNYFGRSLGYFIHDRGEDRLGRHSSRRDLVPPQEERGRFTVQHRHFLPYRWQVTSELSYVSDKNFLEQYYRSEALAEKEQETLLHSKRIQDNWGLSLLAKARINDFMNQLEELPSAEFNVAGQSLWDGRLTYSSHSFASSIRQSYASDTTPQDPTGAFTFLGTRNELDMPVVLPKWRVVPYVAATLGYDDGPGFGADIEGQPVSSEQAYAGGEVGVRAAPSPIWRSYDQTHSRLWDLNGLRHIISPSLLAVAYTQNETTSQQRDLVRLGLSQRLQTKRGIGNKQHTVDWFRLDFDFTWLDNAAPESSTTSNELLWNMPQTPMLDRYSSTAPPTDRRNSNVFGPERSYMGTRLDWRMTATSAVLAEAYYDLQGGFIRRAGVGLARVCSPDLSAYLGTRYLRDSDNQLGQVGSNVFTFAATYRLDPRYAVVFAQQFDFDYGENLRSDIAFIRKYHRMNYALTLGVDGSLDRTSIVFSLWPQGISELALGLSRYIGLGL